MRKLITAGVLISGSLADNLKAETGSVLPDCAADATKGCCGAQAHIAKAIADTPELKALLSPGFHEKNTAVDMSAVCVTKEAQLSALQALIQKEVNGKTSSDPGCEAYQGVAKALQYANLCKLVNGKFCFVDAATHYTTLTGMVTNPGASDAVMATLCADDCFTSNVRLLEYKTKFGKSGNDLSVTNNRLRHSKCQKVVDEYCFDTYRNDHKSPSVISSLTTGTDVAAREKACNGCAGQVSSTIILETKDYVNKDLMLKVADTACKKNAANQMCSSHFNVEATITAAKEPAARRLDEFITLMESKPPARRLDGHAQRFDAAMWTRVQKDLGKFGDKLKIMWAAGEAAQSSKECKPMYDIVLKQAEGGRPKPAKMRRRLKDHEKDDKEEMMLTSTGSSGI